MGNFAFIQQGINIAIIGIAVVFLSLIILFFCMKLFVYALNYSKLKQSRNQQKVQISGRTGSEPISGEIIAAISMAIHLSREEFHDMERTILTFERMARPYSPWSSKIHGIRKFVR